MRWWFGAGALAVLAALVTVVPAALFAPVAPTWLPRPLANWAFDVRLWISRPVLTALSLSRALSGNTSTLSYRLGRPVRFESNGFTLVGTLFDAKDAAGPGPGILLLHGSTPQGHRLGLYGVMGKRLADLGYTVLAIDQRGFGRSSDPPDVHVAESFDFEDDVAPALAYLRSAPGVDPDQVYLIGHSFGGDVAISAVNRGGVDVRKLVLIGPGRRFLERGGAGAGSEIDFFRRRQMRYMKLSEEIPTDVFLVYRSKLPLDNHLDYLMSPGHLPVLLMDGELESEADKVYLKDVYERMTDEKAYITLTKADHYANTANIGSLIVFDEDAITQLVQGIDAFFRP